MVFGRMKEVKVFFRFFVRLSDGLILGKKHECSRYFLTDRNKITLIYLRYIHEIGFR